MISVTKSIKASASTHGWIPVNVYEDASQISLAFTAPAGDWGASLQYTLDDVVAGVSGAPVTFMTIAGSAATTYATAVTFPVRAVRVDVTEASSGSPAVLRVLQSGK